MKKEFVDFEKLFEEYLRKYIKDNNLNDAEKVLSMMSMLYSEWVNTPISKLGGVAPKDYYADIDHPETLVDFLIRTCELGYEADNMLCDRIVEVEGTLPLLRSLLRESRSERLTSVVVRLMGEYGIESLVEEYIELLKDDMLEEDTKNTIIESLKQYADNAKEGLLELIPYADMQLKLIIAEILSSAKHDKRIGDLLTELFVESDNIPLVCSLMAKYGDENLVSILYRALPIPSTTNSASTVSIMENANYKEIRNAIESLGGIVDLTE